MKKLISLRFAGMCKLKENTPPQSAVSELILCRSRFALIKTRERKIETLQHCFAACIGVTLLHRSMAMVSRLEIPGYALSCCIRICWEFHYKRKTWQCLLGQEVLLDKIKYKGNVLHSLQPIDHIKKQTNRQTSIRAKN